jgi:adenylate kinase family enzyme
MIEPPPLVCIIGPPVSGKTTLAENLSSELEAPVIRPRDAITRAVARFPAMIGLFPRDGLGKVPDESLGFALRVELDQLPFDHPVILENLPWTVLQLADLHRVGRRVILLYMHASDELVIERRLGRKDCERCYPRALVTQDGQHCARCCYALTTRRDDSQKTFLDRLTENRLHATRILNLAHRLKLSVVNLEASDKPETIVERALSALSPPLGSLTA